MPLSDPSDSWTLAGFIAHDLLERMPKWARLTGVMTAGRVALFDLEVDGRRFSVQVAEHKEAGE